MMPNREFVHILPLVLAVLLAGCGDGDPVGPQYPQVTGTYTGGATLSAPQLGATITGTARAVVVQSGSQVTITGSLTFEGETTAVPAVTGTINETGFFTATSTGIVGSPSGVCGTVRPVSASLTFAGRTLRWEESQETALCGLISIEAVLTR